MNTRPLRQRRLPASIAAALIALLPAAGLAACSASPDETTCGDYLSESDNDQQDTVRELFSDHGRDNVPDFLVPAAQGSLIGYCNVQGDDATLGDAYDAFESVVQSPGDSGGSGDSSGSGGSSGEPTASPSGGD